MLATIRPDGRARLVPITFAVEREADTLLLYSALDEKPKSVADPRALARVRDILDRPPVSVLVDHWSEDWSALAWLRLDGDAVLVEPDEPDHSSAIGLLRTRYPQYAGQRLEVLPVIRIEVAAVTGWSAT